MDPLHIPRSEHPISRRQIDDDALKVLYRLHRHGRIAYLVGGSVRDLLLGHRPKDFDVVTDAHPGEVKKLFRNSWIVGRRFRLVHVVFGRDRKVVEVATFRAKSEIEPPPEIAESGAPERAEPDGSTGKDASPDRHGQPVAAPGDAVPDRGLLVTWENTFGTPEEDARRRDFTINALFYDIATYSIIDYVGGLEDLRRKMIRTIGDPDVRFQEDPVRMMRAVKFAARLDFSIDPEVERAMSRHAAAIELASPPRVLEEIYRLLESGRAVASFRLLHDTGLLKALIPELEPHARRKDGLLWSGLRELDRVGEAEDVPRAVAMGVLLYHLVRDSVEAVGGGADRLGESIEEAVRPVALRLRMTRADTARILQMFAAQRRFLQPRGRRFSAAGFVRRGYFPGAYQLLRIFAGAAGGERVDVVRRWAERVRSVEQGGDGSPGSEAGVAAEPSRRRRRRRRRRQGGGSGGR